MTHAMICGTCVVSCDQRLAGSSAACSVYKCVLYLSFREFTVLMLCHDRSFLGAHFDSKIMKLCLKIRKLIQCFGIIFRFSWSQWQFSTSIRPWDMFWTLINVLAQSVSRPMFILSKTCMLTIYCVTLTITIPCLHWLVNQLSVWLTQEPSL